MVWNFRLWDGTRAANVDVDNQLQVGLPRTADAKAGFAALMQRITDAQAAVIGRPLALSKAGGMTVAPETTLIADTFNPAAIAQMTTNWGLFTTTQTGGYGSGRVTLNSGSSTAANGNSAIRSWRNVPIFGKNETHIQFTALRTTVPQVNETLEFGAMLATLPGGGAPSDGVFFRYNTAGELRGVISYAGVETQTAAITAPSINVVHKFEIVCDDREVEFWIDDVLQRRITLITDAPGQGYPFQMAAAPVVARYYIGASTPAAATQFNVYEVNAWTSGDEYGMSLPHKMAAMGFHAYQAQPGSGAGSLANYANSANPTAAVPTNTTAALGTGLGGQFWETDTLAVTTDGIISSYQNPLGTVNITPRTLIVNGVSIDTFVQTALTGGGYNEQWSLAFGHASVSLATAEGASAKAARRVGIGQRTVAAGLAALTQLPTIKQTFQNPLSVHPGEFVQTVKKKIGTAPSAGVMAHLITLDAYFAP